ATPAGWTRSCGARAPTPRSASGRSTSCAIRRCAVRSRGWESISLLSTHCEEIRPDRLPFAGHSRITRKERRMRALVADSDPDRLRQLESWLTNWGHDVAPARNGMEAWSRLESERSPILAVLAWNMDGMPGIDVCRRIRLQPELPSAYVLLV